MTVLMFIFLQETYEITILTKKTERLRKETNNPNLRSARDLGLPPRGIVQTSYNPTNEAADSLSDCSGTIYVYGFC